MYRVLDLTDAKGMLCSRLLAGMGAEVIRVERPGGDLSGETAGGPSCLYLNSGKRGITLNLESVRGREVFGRLVKTADVLVESFQPGYLDSLGIGYPALCEVSPPLVMASITGFGQDGPYRDYSSADIVAGALGGWLYVSGESETPPLKPSGDQAYYSASLFAAVGIMLALWSRHATGRGQHIDISLQECVAASLDHVLVRYFYGGAVASRQGSLHWNNAFRVFPCADGYILLTLLWQWETLVEWLDSEGMAEDLTGAKWRDREEQLEHLDHIIKVLERWTKTRRVGELVEKGQLMRFPWAEVASVAGFVDSPQLKERGFFVEVREPRSGKTCKFPGAPVKFSRSPWRVGGYPPEAGEDNIRIYQGELGLSGKEIERLVREGVI